MGALTLYAFKSAFCLSVLYLPFALLLRRETFFAFNRFGLLLIVGLSLVVPCLDIPLWDFPVGDVFESQRRSVVEVGMPMAVKADVAGDNGVAPAGSGALWPYVLVYTYIIGMLACLLVKGRQLYRLLRFIPSGCLWTDVYDGVTIYCHAGSVGAFSWMRKIVVGEADSAPDSPVMMHEMAHATRCHSWDALFVACTEVLQWFNPCIWMLDISLREIHEYEADDIVLRRGVTARNYQLLLIKNAVRGSGIAFANAFNHSLLKKRITMMMKEKSSKWARMRLLYIVPVTLIVIGAFASQKFVVQTAPLGSPSPETAAPENTSAMQAATVADEASPAAGLSAGETKETVPSQAATDLASAVAEGIESQPEPEKKVFDVVEVMPVFPGGETEMMKYVATQVRYPVIAEKMACRADL